MMKRGFTLVEMLVVMAIIVILLGAAMSGYKAAVAKAQTAKAVERVHEVATALAQIYQRDSAWPAIVVQEGSSGNGQLTPEVGGIMAKRGVISLSYRQPSEDEVEDGSAKYVLTGRDKYGLFSPWGEEVIRSRLKEQNLSLSGTKVPSGGTLEDHRLRFAIDDDGDGRVKVNGENVSARVRATVCVWCSGRDGKFGTKDDVKSWADGQEIK